MRHSLVPFALVTLLTAGNPPHPPAVPQAPPPRLAPVPADKVRGWVQALEGEQHDVQQAAMLAFGEALFPGFEAILADPKGDALHVGSVLSLLAKMGGDRRRFREPVVKLLTHPNGFVRYQAVGLLAAVGTAEDTPAVVALLSDRDDNVNFTAAETLAAIGGRRDLLAMDLWLQFGTSSRRDAEYLKFFKGCRDKLAKRLQENEAPKK